jgi:RNA polymerase sigma-70 factor (ECF subfamily)
LLSDSEQRALAVRLRNGERDAWTVLYDAYSADVWRFAARLLGGDAQAVADVVQETFLSAATSAGRFDPERGSLWGWLTGIAHNHVSAWWRQRARAARVQELLEAGKLELRSCFDAAGLAELLQRQELVEVVRYVLAGLPTDYAALLVGKYLDDASLEDLAGRTASSVEAVKSKLARARREFREKFEYVERAQEVRSAGPHTT